MERKVNEPRIDAAEDPAWSRPILVTSAGRSGSTWLARILASDPRIGMTDESGIPETLGALRALVKLPRRAMFEAGGMQLIGLLSAEHHERFETLHRRSLRQLVTDFYRAEFPDRGITVWGDKLRQPEAIPFVLEQFPEARVIHLVRDGRDQVVSMMRYLEGRGSVASSDLSHGFASHCDHWVHVNELIEAHAGGRDLSLRIRYEDLVHDPIATVARVFSLLGLEPTEETCSYVARGDEMLRQHHGTSPSAEASIGRWRTELDPAHRALATERLTPLLTRLGYTP